MSAYLSVSLLLAAVTVTPDSLPARGRQEAVVSLDRAAMVRLSAVGDAGTACEVVDHLRGPFERAGQVGKRNCSLELLLDSGTYKVRLQSPEKGKGKVALKAEPFAEINRPPLKLEPRRAAEQVLRPGQQASYWIRLEKPQPVVVRVSGRTAGRVGLWRNGDWLEPVSPRNHVWEPRPGQSINEWWIDETLEAGDYLLTVWGVDARRWTKGKEEDFLSVAYGFEEGPAERGAVVTLPAWGLAAFEVPPGPVTAFVSRDSGNAALRMEVLPGTAGAARNAGSYAGCTVAPKALVPRCVAQAGDRELPHWVVVRGEPGTQVELRWVVGRWWSSSNEDGAYSSWTSTYFASPGQGVYLVGTHDLVPDLDAAPLGCLLERVLKDGSSQPVARDFLQVSSQKPLERDFNYPGAQTSVWFEVAESGRYRITTAKTRCELFRLEGSRPVRAVELPPDAKTCVVEASLSAGPHQLNLYGSFRGIEHIRVADVANKTAQRTPGKSTCLMPRVQLAGGADYRLTTNRLGDVQTRGLVVRPLPLTLGEPLPLNLEPNAEVRLPMAAGRPVLVRSAAGVPFSCGLDGSAALARDGVCRLRETKVGDTLVLQTGDKAAALTVLRPTPQPTRPPLASWEAPPVKLQEIGPGAPVFLDFDRGQAHSLLLEVKEAGLYHVTTEGLLSTECSLRTPVVARMAATTGGGRGRNCLLAQYLRPGRYLVRANTVGSSRGRAPVVVTRRVPVEKPAVWADGEVFFRVEAGDLVQQKLTVKKAGRHRISTSARGVPLACRLEDPQGWPVVPVPAPCSGELALEQGSYLWSQMPLTVESLRRTRIERVKPPQLLTGDKRVHAVPLNTWLTAKLGKDGQDEFFINLAADLDLKIFLSNRMQGRLYRILEDKSLKPVEVIAPMDTGSSGAWGAPSTAVAEPESEPAAEPPPEEPPPEEPPPEEPPPDESAYAEPPPEETPAETGYGTGFVTPPPAPVRRMAALPSAPPDPPGQLVQLPAGPYKLVTEHSLDDANITYRVWVGSTTLVPGASREVNVPLHNATVRVAQAGTLRLATEGDLDVRCRLFDGARRLVAEADDNGDDWNCAFAEPVDAGDYTLMLESAVTIPGSTKVTLAMPSPTDAPALADGQVLKLAGGVVRAPLPAATGDVVQELRFRSTSPFSVVIEENGRILERAAGVVDHVFLLRPGAGPYQTRLWTLDRPAEVKVSWAVRPVSGTGGRIPAGGALRTGVARGGRFTTAADVRCLPEETRGLLRPCGPEASLEARPVVFAVPGGAETSLPLKELVVPVDEPRTDEVGLVRTPAIQTQTSKDPALHLLALRIPPGEGPAPACRMLDGANLSRDEACFAVATPGRQATGRWWSVSERPVPATLERRAIALPKDAVPVAPGRRTLTWTGDALRLRLSEQWLRADINLPPRAWAVVVGPDGRPADLCGPSETLARCVLAGSLGELIIYSPAAARAEAEFVATEPAADPAPFAGVFEAVADAPGHVRLQFAPIATARTLRISGADRCALVLDDGTRLESCSPTVPAATSAVLELDHAAGEVRVVAPAGPADLAAWFGGPPPPGKPGPVLPLATDLPLPRAGTIDRTLVLDAESALHLRSDAGVCALLGDQGFVAVRGGASGCAIDRLLPAGRYRLVVRPFGRQPLKGAVRWTADAVEVLGDGVGPERTLGPGQSRLYRFAVSSAGRVGLGLQVPAERLQCALLDADGGVIGTGCQQFVKLEPGLYLLGVSAPADVPATWFKPVVFGLAGSKMEVPEEYLRDFFQRIGGAQ